jgi:TolB-like protein/Flp pilus assembly protein TadD
VAKRDAAALLPLAESIADGAVVDWASVEAAAAPDHRRIIRELRVLAELTTLHRTLADEDAATPEPLARTESAPAIGRWAHLDLIARIGGGSFGEVYRAWDRHLERQVALKLLRSTDESGDPFASRIVSEGRLLASVRHPNVVAVHGVAEHEGRVGLWMELVDGTTLEDVLAGHGPFSAAEAALIGIDLCRALAAIHRAGLVHRDVKTQNVVRERGGRVVLMDFGAGRRLDAAGVSDRAGTPLSLAPELFEGAQASARTDLYSLGVLLYRLVTGEFPVRAATMEELEAAHRAGRVAHLRDARPELPAPFVRVIDRAIARDPQKRFATAGELEAALAQSVSAAAGEASGPAAAAPSRWIWGAVAAAAAAVVAAVVLVAPLVRSRSSPSSSPAAAAHAPIRSIAVLPLVNLSGDPSQEYFADGMTEQLIATIGQLAGINVISRTSAMQFKGSKTPLPAIARALHVDAVLEGSVQMTGSGGRANPGGKQVRVNARLIYAGTDTQVWDRTFERVISDVFSLQADVAKAVAEGIGLRLQASTAPAAAPRSIQPSAYEAYLRGVYLLNKRTPADIRSGIEQFRAAIDADPAHPLAWAGLSDGYSLLASYDEERPRDARPRAKAAALKALELDDSLAEAHTALAIVQWTYDWDLPAAEAELRRAIALRDNYAIAHAWYGLLLNELGRFDQALAETRRAQELDPLSLIIDVNVGRCFYFARNYTQALEHLQALARREPDYWIVHAILGQTYLAMGRVDDAITELERARQIQPSVPRNAGVLGDAYGRAGRRADARQLAAGLTQLAQRRYVPPVYEAMVYMGMGDARRAVDLLRRTVVDRSDWVVQLASDPQFDPIRTDPGFRALLESAGLTPKSP